eukprot:TRINITY_DN45252_c0_g1_i1.p1 TRINITY_DN45252_c0_g1~~TRINITY_DN45252_c0_g1_i1.p1  ORF type:complete len:140 (-),score=24.78 TRINITY_DN45252_c0_g1_i1:376-795(-)
MLAILCFSVLACVAGDVTAMSLEFDMLDRRRTFNAEVISRLNKAVDALSSSERLSTDAASRRESLAESSRFGIVAEGNDTNVTNNWNESWVDLANSVFDAKNIAAVNLVFTFVAVIVAVVTVALAAHLRSLVANRGGPF